jgi:hypothetical protein
VKSLQELPSDGRPVTFQELSELGNVEYDEGNNLIKFWPFETPNGRRYIETHTGPNRKARRRAAALARRKK